jgi:hypothetical protein
MFFTVGQKVTLKYTEDEGTVMQLHQDGMVMVRLDDSDMTIPIFEEDLLPANSLPIHKSKELSNKKDVQIPDFPIATQYGILHSLGLQVAFEAVTKYENIEKYHVYLINDTNSELVYIFKLRLADDTLFEVDNKIGSIDVQHLGELYYDELNDIPEVYIEVKEITTEGLGDALTKSIKLKPQIFFKNVITAPLLNKRVHHFVLFEKFDNAPKPKSQSKEDLKTYTKRLKEPIMKVQPTNSNSRRLNRHEIEEFANFNPVIDLHIENLTANSKGMTNGEIINMQLQYFERFMQKAYRLGVPRVFIIHGVGKGKLRDAIATKLLQEYDIQTFKNEYHPKYGFGATEVVF